MTWPDITLGPCRLICGDATQVLPTLAAASVQLIIVDPPYFRTKLTYAGERVEWDRQWPTREAYLDWLRGLAQEWQRVLTQNGSLYCFASPQMAARVEVTLSETFNMLQRITWRKPPFATKAEMFDKESCRMFFPASEAIMFAEQLQSDEIALGESGYAAQCERLHGYVFSPLGRYIAEERLRAGATRDEVDVALGFVRTKNPQRGTELCRRWEEGSSLPTRETYGRLRDYLNARNGHADYLRREYEDLRREYEDLRREYEDLRREYEDLRRPFTVSPQVPYTDVWDFATVPPALGKHPAEKPLPLLRHIIEVSSRPGDTVLDCCAGSFSTLEAARQCGRQGIGIEQDRHWWQYGRRRLSQETLFTRMTVAPERRPMQTSLFG